MASPPTWHGCGTPAAVTDLRFSGLTLRGRVGSASMGRTHRAFDAHLFGINPDTLTAEARPEGPSLNAMGIVYPKMILEYLPHLDALAWRYNEWRCRTGRAPEARARQ